MQGFYYSDMDILDVQTVEGEIGLTVDYAAGNAAAIDVLSGAVEMIAALDALDRALLSSVDTGLEPVSILNDVQHSSLKILLARALRNTPDDTINSIDWKRWLGTLLVKGKYLLLKHLDADAPQLAQIAEALKEDYASAPSLVGYEPPTVDALQRGLNAARAARQTLAGCTVVVQTELGDITLPNVSPASCDTPLVVAERVVNRGREWLKVRYPDMLGQAQWTVQRAGRVTRVSILHKAWLDAYHRREIALLPGDALDCEYEETIEYDAAQNEIGRYLTVIQVHGVKSPPQQSALI